MPLLRQIKAEMCAIYSGLYLEYGGVIAQSDGGVKSGTLDQVRARDQGTKTKKIKKIRRLWGHHIFASIAKPSRCN